MRRLAVLLACAAAAVAAAAPPAGAVVGGEPTTIDQVPWQAAVLPGGLLCGGSVVDATHVVTAAHCTYRPDGAPFVPSDVRVVAASTRHDGAEPGSQVRSVVAISRHPAYDDGSLGGLPANDAAVLTLDTALDLSMPGAAPVALGDDARLGLWDGLLDDTALVSGWGVTEAGSISSTVRRATMPVFTDAQCAGAWGSGYSAAGMLCGSTDEIDTCQGDSGGPAVVLDDERPFLAGITSFGGSECAVAAVPGVYTELAAVRSFVEPTPAAPQRLADPSLAGTPRSGEVLTCGHGRWTGSPALGFAFVRTDAGIPELLPSDGGRRYRLRDVDAGTTVACRVTAANAAGAAVATSASTARVAAAEPGPAPAPAPAATEEISPTAPEPQAPEPPPAPEPAAVPPPADRIPPVARAARLRCGRVACTFRIVASDAEPSSGLRAVAVRVLTTVRVPCPRRTQRRRCTRTLVALVPTRGRGRVRTATVRRPAAGAATLVAIARDVAGNRQVRAARARVPPRRDR